MKQPLKWHRECLDNSIRYTEQKKRELENHIRREQDAIESLEEDIATYQKQMDIAEKLGASSFDRERYGVKRKKK